MESIFAILGVFFAPMTMVIFIVWFKVKERRHKNQLQADLLAKALETGKNLPAELFVEPEKKNNPLKTGLICIAVGIGLSLFFWLSPENSDLQEWAAAGIIPSLIGVAYLIIHFIEKKKKKNEETK